MLASSLGAMEWNVDRSHSAAHFSVKHMMVSTVRGSFDQVSGTVNFDPAAPESASVQIEIHAASINTGNDGRDDHLRNPDFFDVEKFPTLRFQSTSVEKVADGEYLLKGNLTIRDVTREVTFEVEGPAAPLSTNRGMRTGASATATIDRTDFGLTWNRMIEAGGVTVGNEVRITIDLELTEAQPPQA